MSVKEAPTESLSQRLLADVAASQSSVLKRFSPRRSRWPELHAFDERLAEIDARQARANDELAELRERLAQAKREDSQALADWIAAGEKGARPEPTVPKLERRIAEREADRDAANAASDRVLKEKAAFVERHRKRLVQEADRATQDAAVRYTAAIRARPASRRRALAAPPPLGLLG